MFLFIYVNLFLGGEEMLNQIILVGRLVKDPEVREYEKKKVSKVILAVPRAYKNINGEYETDFLECTLWQGMAENTFIYCKKGDLVGIRGRLQSNKFEKDGTIVYKTEILAEKVTFLSTKKNNEGLEVCEEEK